ncbi:MAG TPA: DUF169 domain-containing protein [Syntrophorhabdaceae bacterium]|nr:DUF169 domain-containing protein [Syntrophorhabdaceae bacterium]
MTQSSFRDKDDWLEISEKLNLQAPPVGVKYCTAKPEDAACLEGTMPLCEMLAYSQKGHAFYAAPENHLCGAALYSLGKDLPPVYTSGVYGTGLEIFDSPRSGSRLYDHIPRLEARRNINFVMLSPLNKLTHDPDLLIFLTQEEQSEILLRAMSYSTGKMWISRSTGVIGCAWLFVYPYLSGELNYTPILSLGMRARKVFPPGTHLISIPFDLSAGMLDSLKRMPLTLSVLKPGGDEFRAKLLSRLGLEPAH